MAAILEDVKTGRCWALSRGLDNVVGRAATTGVCVLDGTVAREHALVRDDELGWQIQDLGSPSGTYWNGGAGWTRIKRQALRSGDLLSLGAVSLRFLEDGLADTDVESAEAIVARLRDHLEQGENPYSVQCLVARLALLGGDTAPALQAAREAMRSAAPQARRAAAFALGPLCRSPRLSAPPITELVELTADEDAAVRGEAVAQLGAAGGAPIEPFLRALKDPDVEVFRATVRAIRLRPSRFAPHVEVLLTSSPSHRRPELEELAAILRKQRLRPSGP